MKYSDIDIGLKIYIEHTDKVTMRYNFETEEDIFVFPDEGLTNLIKKYPVGYYFVDWSYDYISTTMVVYCDTEQNKNILISKLKLYVENIEKIEE